MASRLMMRRDHVVRLDRNSITVRSEGSNRTVICFQLQISWPPGTMDAGVMQIHAIVNFLCTTRLSRNWIRKEQDSPG